MVLRSNRGECIGLVSVTVEVGLSDSAENTGEAAGHSGFFFGVRALLQNVADLFRGQRGHLFHADYKSVLRAPRPYCVECGVNRRRAGCTCVLAANGRRISQAWNRVEDKRGGKVLINKAGVEGADVNRVDGAGVNSRVLDSIKS